MIDSRSKIRSLAPFLMKKQIAKLINGPVGNLLLIAGAIYFVFDFFDLKIVQDSELFEDINEESPSTKNSIGLTSGLEYDEIENWCREKDSINVMGFNDCMSLYVGSSFVPEREPDTVVHKGITYTASRICPAGEKMYWQTSSGFMRKTKISELGCMTASQNEAYWRNYNLRQAGAPKGGSYNSDGYFIKQQMQMQRSVDNYKRTLDNYGRTHGHPQY